MLKPPGAILLEKAFGPRPSVKNSNTRRAGSCGITLTLAALPSRRYSTSSSCPTATPSMNSSNNSLARAGLSALKDSPLIAVITSPASNPACSPPPPGVTPTIFTPATGPFSSSSPSMTPSIALLGRRSLMCSIVQASSARFLLSSAIFLAACSRRISASRMASSDCLSAPCRSLAANARSRSAASSACCWANFSASLCACSSCANKGGESATSAQSSKICPVVCISKLLDIVIYMETRCSDG